MPVATCRPCTARHTHAIHIVPTATQVAEVHEARLCVAARLRPLAKGEHKSVWTAVPDSRTVTCSVTELPGKQRKTSLHDCGPCACVRACVRACVCARACVCVRCSTLQCVDGAPWHA